MAQENIHIIPPQGKRKHSIVLEFIYQEQEKENQESIDKRIIAIILQGK